uniref:Uncharacterized protein n=1 Tax=Branchiostoma floridae TaxID=7739 RepID=C3ZFW8_BRAFL|eukprot:XP_002592595.1 hypothetical protein BRAFLDRAFT_68918 [Branchiostoma floridae]
MSNRLVMRLILLLMIFKESGAATPCESCSRTCDCRDKDLRSVPQDLPTKIVRLDLDRNAIVSLKPSDFSRQIMSNRLVMSLILLLMIFKESGAATPCDSCSRTCDCRDKDLRSVPQDLPPKIVRLDLDRNAIVSLKPSDFSRSHHQDFWSRGRIMYYRFAALYFITYVIALPLLCWDMRYSMYFRVFRRLNLMVLKRVQPQIVITVVTIARQPQNGVNKHRYLTQVVTQFAELLEHEEAADVVFQVCNVNVPPEAHHEAVFLSKYVPVVQRESNEEQTEEEDPFEREKLDYIFCLEKSVELNPEYVLMVEDDALPTPDILHVLRHKLQYRLKLRIRQGEFVHHSDDWAFLKLYDIERLQGYGNDARSFLELTGAGFLGGTAFLLVLQKRGHKTQRRLFIFALGFVYVVLLCWAIGRQYFLQLRRLSPQLYTVTTGPFCCTPAVVYPVKMAADIAAFLKTGTCEERYPLDFALSDFAIDKGLTRYKVEPNLVLHVGLVSSIRADVRNPFE